ncbi:hypothetical protein K0U27_10570 [archaeon]|nr:hypothetical protein [archaeon]
MSSLTNKYSNWQIYGFFGLFLANVVWAFYALVVLKALPGQSDVVNYFYDVIPILGIHVTIPLVVSFLISFKMYRNQMLSKSNFAVLLLSGFLVSFIFVMSDYFLLGK